MIALRSLLLFAALLVLIVALLATSISNAQLFHTLADVSPDGIDARVNLILVTPTNRPFYLSKLLPHVLPLQKCFNVTWLIVHSVDPNVTGFAPVFRSHFPWITEVRFYLNDSSYGGGERNLGRNMSAQLDFDEAMIYFLDDDNTPPDLCRMIDPKILQLETLYYADQLSCGRMRLQTTKKKWTGWTNVTKLLDSQLRYKLDTGSFLVPLALIRNAIDIPWGLTRVSDAPFFAAIIMRWMAVRGAAFVQRLPVVQFHYNHLSEVNGCLLNPWVNTTVNSSLVEYRALLGNMTMTWNELRAARAGVPLPRSIIQHEYGHILGSMRTLIDQQRPVYLELNAHLGVNAVYMAQHGCAVIGQTSDEGVALEEASQALRDAFVPVEGRSAVHWIKNTSQMAFSEVRHLLRTVRRHVDILHINLRTYRSSESVMNDFKLYAQLVGGNGFVVFDEFLDHEAPSGHSVREAVMTLVEFGQINSREFEIIGTPKNEGSAGPYQEQISRDRDWPTDTIKQYVLRKRSPLLPHKHFGAVGYNQTLPEKQREACYQAKDWW